MQCAFHPRVETVLRCSRCERPICGRCAITTPVGSRCRECARVQRLPTYSLGLPYLARGIGSALAAGLGAGVILGLAPVFGLVPFPIYWLYIPLALVASGYLVGEAVSIATNRKRGPALQGLAVAGYALAFLAFELVAPGNLLVGIYSLVGLVVGAAIAIGRVR